MIVHTTPEHEELKAIATAASRGITPTTTSASPKRSGSCSRRKTPPRVKPLLYVYRVLLTGIHLMRTGEVEANLLRLNETAKLPYIADLIARKIGGPEKGDWNRPICSFHRAGIRAALPRTRSGVRGEPFARRLAARRLSTIAGEDTIE